MDLKYALNIDETIVSRLTSVKTENMVHIFYAPVFLVLPKLDTTIPVDCPAHRAEIKLLKNFECHSFCVYCTLVMHTHKSNRNQSLSDGLPLNN